MEESSAPVAEVVDYAWTPSFEQILDGGEPAEAYGWQTVILADVNGDGFDELAVASVGNPELDLSGRVVVHYGAADGLATTPDWQVGVDEWPAMEISDKADLDEGEEPSLSLIHI